MGNVLDYMQRVGEGVTSEDQYDFVDLSKSKFKWFRIDGVSTPGKADNNNILSTSQALLSQNPQLDSIPAGLHGATLPIAFSLSSTGHGFEICFGTWATSSDDLAGLESAIRTCYPTAELTMVGPSQETEWDRHGVALGSPPPQLRSLRDAALPVDRIAQALAGHCWQVVVLAAPMADRFASDLRDMVLNEMRLTDLTLARERSSNPLASTYLDLLKPLSWSLTESTASGLWRTGIYLFGTTTSYPVLAGAWKATYCGGDLRPEPTRVWEWPEVSDCANRFLFPDRPGEPGPGSYRRSFHYQSMLSSNELAAFTHLPEREYLGFSISLENRFDVSPRVRNGIGGKSITIGTILGTPEVQDAGDLLSPAAGPLFELELDDLTRHTFVCGVTGSGKTNTIFSNS